MAGEKYMERDTDTSYMNPIMDQKDYDVGKKKNGLEIRILKMHEIQDGQMKRYELGNSNGLSIFKLILVGETGSGKTTFINSLVNNIFGVDYYDKFRYSICKLNNMSRSESESQTDFVTEYTFNYIKGMKRKCNFVIVDTPGLEDTRGVDIQNKNIQQIHEYISEHPSQIGFTIQSSTNRLAAKQKSVLLELKDMIKSGKIYDIIILSTFADSDSPSVKNVLDGFDIPYSNLFLFNNNALFSRNKDIPNNDLKSFKMNWEASNISMNNLLDFMWMDVKAHFARNIGQNESKKLSTSNKIYKCDTAMAKEDKQVPDAMNMKPELVENLTKTNTIASENASNKADELASVEEQMSTSESSATSSPRVQEDNPITSKDPDATNLRKDLVENVTKTNTIASENASNKDDGIASVNDQMPTSESSATSPPIVQEDNPISLKVPDVINLRPDLVGNLTETNTIASENASKKADELASVEEQMSTSESSATPPPKVQENNPITSKDISDALKELGLEEDLSYNFGINDILTVTRSSLEGKIPQTFKEKLLYIVSRIVMLDYRSRDIEVCLTSTQRQENKSEMVMNDIDEIDSIFNEISKGFNENTQNILHPSDVMVILMNCCDDNLRQILVHKMSVCKLAIPLVHLNFDNSKYFFLSWGMRFINMSLKTQLKDSDEDDSPIPIVSAIRLGDIPTSKSKMLNEVLYTQPHNVYFNRDCNSGHLSRKFSGVVELAWYLPAGKKEDVFDNVLALANLRGDAKNYIKQFEFLHSVSSIILIFLSLQNISDPEYLSILKTLSSSHQKLIFIFLDTITHQSLTDFKKCMGNKKFSAVLRSVKGDVKNAAKLTAELRTKMKLHLDTQSKTEILNWETISDIARNIGIEIDEDNKSCQTGKHMANTIINNISNKDVTTIKNQVLPLQGHLWSEWSNMSKKQARLDGVLGRDQETFIAEMHEKKEACRKSQYSLVENMTQSMNFFVEKLIQTKDDLDTRLSFMQWMKLLLDGISHKELPKLQKIYHSLWNDLQDQINYTKQKEKIKERIKKIKEMHVCEKQKLNEVEIKEEIEKIQEKEDPIDEQIHNDDLMEIINELQEEHKPEKKKFNEDEIQNKIKENQKKLDVVENNLVASSFVLEHFMREVGQVYEAIAEDKRNKLVKIRDLKQHLPQIAADLLISGFPLEIMDGDVAHMPLTWVKAVFDCLKSSLGNQRVYVISVLGVQSSGKSTLLNTMFGLNFAVSAGRCTRGVYAQLIPVEEDLKLELGYDHILILDTEGLRAPELGKSKLDHDNELATLVIGMGDITILNIKGENTAEIEDILQIAVHAFLRMKLVTKSLKLQPGCYFVHQNVPAVNAENQMLYGHKKIQQQLNSITKAAAEQENVTNIEYFTDVIEFDVKKNVWHFSGLWQGDPPMAPVNHNYSEKVLELKNDLIMYPSMKKINCLTFTDLSDRMSDLWNAILHENFVFSFKNSFELKAYASLEEIYSSLSWNFRNEVKKWITSSLKKVKKCEENTISELKVSINRSLSECIEENFLKNENELGNFFNNDKAKNILVQWKSNIELKLQSLKEELKHDAEKTCQSHFAIRRAQLVHENETVSYQNQLNDLVKNLVNNDAMGELSDELMKKKFDEMWKDWIQVMCLKEIDKKDIFGDVLTILTAKFKMHSKILQNVKAQYIPIKRLKCELDQPLNIDDGDYAANSTMKKIKEWTKEKINLLDNRETIIEIKKLTNETVTEIEAYLNGKKGHDYDYTFVHEIVHTVSENVKKFNSDNKCYELKTQYEIKLTVHILLNVVPTFETMHSVFRRENDPKRFLELNTKPLLLEFFRGTVKQCKREKTAAEMLCPSLEAAILESVKENLPLSIADKVRTSKHEFKTHAGLYAKVLGSLLEKENFDKYTDFLKNTNKSLQGWLKIYVAEYCNLTQKNGKRNIVNAANEMLKDKVLALQSFVKDVNASMSPGSNSFPNWLKQYSNVTIGTITLNDKLFDVLGSQKIENIDYFEKNILLVLENLKAKFETIFNKWSKEELNSLNEEPHIIIAKNILGCTKQCPFCKTICTNMSGCTSHSNPLHLPRGIGGSRDYDSEKLISGSCNAAVASTLSFMCNDLNCKCHSKGWKNYWKGQWHDYNNYKEAGGDFATWNIIPDTDFSGTKYWKFVFYKFSKEFAKYHNAKSPDMPHAWSLIEKHGAKESLESQFNV